MKTVFLGNDVEAFILNIIDEIKKGRNVKVAMHGYKAIVYANSSEETIRREIVMKLKTIALYESNQHILRTQMDPVDLSRYLVNSMPEDISDLCLENGISGLQGISKVM